MVVLITAIASWGNATPIIGPPARSTGASSRQPPTASARCDAGVPSATSKVAASATPSPPIVTKRETSGSPCTTARQADAAVATF
jgi:hypothetical protein